MSTAYSYEDLPQYLIDRVKKECKEDPKQIYNHLESFKRWISSMKHLSCPTDDAFLIRFLRVAKYDHQKAEQRLDNFCTARRSTRGSSHWFPKDFSITDPLVEEILSQRMQTPLGVTKDGTFVVLLRPKLWDTEKISLEKLGIVIFMGMDYIAKHQQAQITGLVAIIDLEGGAAAQMKMWANKRHLMKEWARAFQDAYPLRVKGIVYYREPAIFDVFFGFMTFFLNEKIKNKISRVKDNLPKLHEKVPGAEDILPNEYGGKAGTFEEANDRYQKNFREYFANGNPLEMIAVDECQRPSFTLKFLKEYQDYKGELNFGETKGTFTKLSV